MIHYNLIVLCVKLKAEFLALDLDGDGNIQTKEMEQMLMEEKIKLRMSLKEIKTLLGDLDKDGDGTIDIQEFLDKVGTGSKRDVIHKALVKRAGIRKQFEKYDKDGSGFITRDEFTKVVEDKYGQNISSKERKFKKRTYAKLIFKGKHDLKKIDYKTNFISSRDSCYALCHSITS